VLAVGPFSIAVGAPQDLVPPQGIWPAVELINGGLYTCQVSIGNQPTVWLPPGTYRTVDLSDNPGATVTVTPLTTPGAVGPATLWAAWLQPKDQPGPGGNYTQSSALSGGVPSMLVDPVAYDPATTTTYALTAVPAILDPTNLVVSFTVPSNGKALVSWLATWSAAPGYTVSAYCALNGVLVAASKVQVVASPGALSVCTLSSFYLTGLTAAATAFVALGGAASGPGILADSGPNGQTLSPTGTVTSIASPAGAAFNQAVQFGSGASGNASGLSGPAGANNAQGAVTGSAYTFEFLYTPTAADIAYGANLFLAVRGLAANPEWYFYMAGGTGTVLCNVYIGGANHVVGTSAVLVAGTTYAMALTWNGATYTFWVNGVSKGTYASALLPTAVSQALFIGTPGTASSPGGPIDEVRISSVCRYSGAYSPATAEFSSDGNTGALYHFDTVASGGSLSCGGAVGAALITVEACP
jgi:Concanavalin A-like lectin/glucanases superfamily